MWNSKPKKGSEKIQNLMVAVNAKMQPKRCYHFVNKIFREFVLQQIMTALNDRFLAL